ncbi:hypothetical protein [Devosia lacusdianchii]|uniref:hypothetical protein n=1 Tax=Devosia lacusdianchii TaxID=2917991 RepID=UPI001F063C6A|nr:hypothetical protein [Devosia sp. JXJ CY 41]
MNRIWDFLIRLRTWIIGGMGIILVMLPDLLVIAAELLNSPDLVAVLPESWKSYAAVAALIFTVWSRWRPATRAADPEVQVKKAIEETADPSTIKVIENGKTKAVIHG